MCFGLYREQSFGSGDTYQEPICRANVSCTGGKRHAVQSTVQSTMPSRS